MNKKVFLPPHHTLTPLIWSIQQCCCHKSMMTWKTVLILSHCLDTSRTLFLAPTDVSLWDVNSGPGQTLLKGSGLEFCLCQWYWLVVLFWFVCVIHSYTSHVPMFGIRAIFHFTIWLKNRKVWAMRDRSFGIRNIGVLDIVLVLAIYFCKIYHAEIADCNGIFSLSLDYWNSKWHSLPFDIPPILQVLFIFLQQTWRANDLSWSPRLTPK